MNEKLITAGLGHYIYSQHIKPSGRGFIWWSRRIGIDQLQFRRVLENRKIIPVDTIVRIAKYLGELPQTYLRIQDEFFLSKVQPIKRIPEIISKVNCKERSFHGVLKEHLVSKNVTMQDVANQMKIELGALTRYFSRSNRGRPMKYIEAGRLGDALGTSPRIWLDLQSEWYLRKYLNEHPYMSKYFDVERLSQRSRRRAVEISSVIPPNPGQVLDDCFLKPSGILREYWANYFCMSRHTLKAIINGERLMKFKFIALLVKAFDVCSCDWIEMQNDYLTHKYFERHSSKFKIERIRSKPRIGGSNLSHHPGNILWSHYMHPINLSTVELALHVGVPRSSIDNLIQGKDRLSHSLTIKLSQAFDTTPMYWLDLQINYDLINQQSSSLYDLGLPQRSN
jgi:addiction module HigA family antidote